MRCGMKVLPSVTILRVVAASHLPACTAHTQMNPGIAESKALLATARGGHIGLYGSKVYARVLMRASVIEL